MPEHYEFLVDTIALQHQEWEETVVTNASEWQRHDLKIAFYSGVAALFRIMYKTQDELADDQVSEKLESLMNEAAIFLGMAQETPTQQH